MIIGNWKMHKTPSQTREFIQELKKKVSAPVYLAVPFPALLAAYEAAKGSSIAIGAQNLSEHVQGAYTGEVSATMIKEAGSSFVLIGHSERRHIYGETDTTICAKLKRACEAGLTPVLCIGETENEREQGQTHTVLKRQLSEGLAGYSTGALVIAYEPVWAIGTNKSATPRVAQEAHHFIRNELTSKDIPILYGGSVKPSNVKDLLAEADIDGALVGGASLDVESFYQLTRG